MPMDMLIRSQRFFDRSSLGRIKLLRNDLKPGRFDQREARGGVLKQINVIRRRTVDRHIDID